MKTLRPALILWILPFSIYGQFSPGKLSKYHAELEGTTNCVKCHELRKKEISDGCITCHQPLKLRIEAGKGYHRDKKDKCEECHSDHNGREFELVYWPKNIRDFNHNKTGYSLTGKHKPVQCGKCHTKEFIVGRAIVDWADENTTFPVLDRTFLGLSQECKICHDDIHKNEVSNDCESCHNTFGWKEASKNFDHSRARFLLTGAHRKITCEKCHQTAPDRTSKVWQLTGMAFDKCTRCHEDFHRGSYGATCETCHTTGSWKKNLKPFNHSQTNYQLSGKHENVSCDKCHTAGTLGGLPKYDTCLDCHNDYHYSQFILRRDKGNCGACHTVNGFKPTTFTVINHRTGNFALEGAHLAVPCSACHKPYEPVKGLSTTRFTWSSVACNICHEDEHRNQFREHYENDCALCHNVDQFSKLNFDHQKTEFPLDGKHSNVACGKCHTTFTDSKGSFIRYNPVAHRCVDCHTITGEIR